MLAVRQSSHQHIERTRRYLSAKHACERYCEMKHNLEGCKAIDLSNPLVQSSPRSESPATDNISDIQILEQTFATAKGRVRDIKRWDAWCCIRIAGYSQRETARLAGVSKRAVEKWVEYVDALVVNELSDRGMMVRNEVRISSAPIVDVYQDGDRELPAAACGGRSRVSVLRMADD